MAKFTEVAGFTAVTTSTLYVGQTHRFRFHADVPKAVPTVASLAPHTVKVVQAVLFDGPKGILSVDLQGVAAGSTSVVATVPAGTTTSLTVTVKAAPAVLALPAATTQSGLLARLLLAEAVSPVSGTWSASDVETGMQWMRLVVHNRLKWPKLFGAPADAKTLEQIVKAEGQFKGFSRYPTIDSGTQANIDALVARANKLDAPDKDNYHLHVSAALAVADAASPVGDPSQNGLIGWRTAGSGSPGSNFALFQTKCGNEFYQWKSAP